MDWDYPGDVQIPGTRWWVGLFGVDKPGPYDEYRLCIGYDTNNNHQLDVAETVHSIGKCPWVGGGNRGWMERYGSEWYVHWVSDKPPFHDNNNIVHFIYKVNGNLLKVFVRTNGQTIPVHQDSPDRYQW